ncbi:MAG: HAD-IA family hydrolase [Bacilli bacterium]|nr:HAD-IA family hydrolase [Bacilli bacterium]
MYNIIFDLGGVILKDKSINVLSQLNLTDDEYQELSKFFDNFKPLDLGKMTLEEKFYNCNINKNIEEKYKDFLINYYKKREIDFELIKLIDKLKRLGHHIYILSDNNLEAINYYKKLDHFKDIDGFIASYEYGTLKRDGKLFQIFLDKYHLEAENCYFIDDRDINIKVAEEYGFKTFKYDFNIDELKEDLRKNNILSEVL